MSEYCCNICHIVVYISGLSNYHLHLTDYMSTLSPNLVSVLLTRLDADISELGYRDNLAFGGILDDFTFTGRPRYALATSGLPSAVSVALFPHRKPPGYVNDVSK